MIGEHGVKISGGQKQRLSTVEQADRICVLEHGHLVEEGTHTELLAQAGIYSRLQRMQFGAARAGA